MHVSAPFRLLTIFGLLSGAFPVGAAQPYLEDFDDGQAQEWKLTEDWRVDGKPDTGVQLRGTSKAAPGYAIYDAHTWTDGYAYTVRLNIPASPNRTGAVFNYRDEKNFDEVALDSKGGLTLTRIANGDRSILGTGTYSGPLRENRWTDMQIVRLGTKVTICIEGTAVLRDVELASTTVGGRIGLMANGQGRFDYVVVTQAARPHGPDFPRLATVRIGAGKKGSARQYDDPATQADLAKVHVAVLHYDSSWQRTHDSMNDVVKELRARNPDIKVVLYTKANEINFTNSSHDKSEAEVRQKVHDMDWWVRDAKGNPVRSEYKDEFKLVNLTRYAPKSDGLTWAQWYAQWTYDKYLRQNPLVDGLYMDNVSWQPHRTAMDVADWNRDGKPDPSNREDVRSWFRQGYRDYLDEIGRRMPPGKLKLVNAARWGQSTPEGSAPLAEYYGAAHGGVIESLIAKGKKHAPEEWGGWLGMMRYYRKVMSVFADPKIGIMMHGLTSASDYQDMRYGLSSCLLDDGYYAPHVQSEGYISTRWYDEFGVKMGQAITPPPTSAWQDGVWRRDFEHAIALVNPKGNGPRTIDLNGTFRKIDGTQDRDVNDGKKVTSVTLQDRDGIILLKQGDEVKKQPRT